MTWIYSSDGTTLDKRLRDRPDRHWDQTSPDAGQWHDIRNDPDANSWGYHELEVVGTNQGDGWVLGPVTNTGPHQWQRAWVFDQAVADDLADATDRDADGAQLGQSLAAMRSIIDSSGSVPAADVRKIARAVARLIRSQRLDQQ